MSPSLPRRPQAKPTVWPPHGPSRLSTQGKVQRSQGWPGHCHPCSTQETQEHKEPALGGLQKGCINLLGTVKAVSSFWLQMPVTHMHTNLILEPFQPFLTLFLDPSISLTEQTSPALLRNRGEGAAEQVVESTGLETATEPRESHSGVKQ